MLESAVLASLHLDMRTGTNKPVAEARLHFLQKVCFGDSDQTPHAASRRHRKVYLELWHAPCGPAALDPSS